MYPWIPWKLVADHLGSAENNLGNNEVQQERNSRINQLFTAHRIYDYV
jgi:hypothetical protein